MTRSISPVSLPLSRVSSTPGPVPGWASRSVVFLIRCYQLGISPLLGPNCRFTPSCSAYAAEAVLTHGLMRGSLLAVRRILRCHPWSAGGYDPVMPPSHLSSPIQQEHSGHHGK